MSYEPTLVLRRDQLQKAESKLESEAYGTNPGKTRVAEFLLRALKSSEVLKFGKINLILIKPELTGFNKAVREKLYEIGVYFQESP